MVKRVPLTEFDTSRKTTDATKLSANDGLVCVGIIHDKQSVVMISKTHMSVSFDCASAKLLKKNSVGIIGMKFEKNDHVEFACITTDNGEFKYSEKTYSVLKIDSGKRATKGKLIKNS